MSGLSDKWGIESLGSIARGGLLSDGDWVESKDQDPNGKIRLTQLADIGDGFFRDRSDRWINHEQAKRLNVTYLKPNDILIARMPDPLGRACLVPDSIGDAVTVVDVAILRVDREDVNRKYVSLLLNSPGVRQQMLLLASGTTRQRISRRNLETIDLPLPDFHVQSEIVEILEDHLSRLDAALENVRRAKKKADTFKKALLAKAFSGGLTHSDHSGHQTAIPWPVLTLDDLVTKTSDIVDGPFGSNLKTSHYRSTGARVVRLQNIGYGRFVSGDAFIDVEHFKTLEKHSVEQGDLLFASLGDSLPRTCLAPDLDGPAIVKADCIRIRLAPEINRKWVLYATLTSAANHWALEQLHGLGRLRLGLGAIRRFPVPMPPIEEQNRLVAFLDEQFSRVDECLSLAGFVDERASSLRRSLLSAAFSGQLTNEVRNV
jgi:type I restriction enzyme S subunit